MLANVFYQKEGILCMIKEHYTPSTLKSRILPGLLRQEIQDHKAKRIKTMQISLLFSTYTKTKHKPKLIVGSSEPLGSGVQVFSTWTGKGKRNKQKSLNKIKLCRKEFCFPSLQLWLFPKNLSAWSQCHEAVKAGEVETHIPVFQRPHVISSSH